jgi:uncharacterized protein with HEPN domain
MSEGRDMRDFLEDALDAMEKAEQFTSEMSYEAFKKDDKTIFAVIRALEVIGEAIKHIPDDFRTTILMNIHFMNCMMPLTKSNDKFRILSSI